MKRLTLLVLALIVLPFALSTAAKGADNPKGEKRELLANHETLAVPLEVDDLAHGLEKQVQCPLPHFLDDGLGFGLRLRSLKIPVNRKSHVDTLGSVFGR